jgi:creatinine amidohydrolase
LGELTYHDLKHQIPDVAVLPFGATEPHNLHLPYATDTIEADLIASTVCESAHQRGARVVCLPTVPYGTETNQSAFPFAMNLQPSTVQTILRDLVASLEKTGIRKCVILNSHGGNAFKGILRELFGQTQVHLFLCNWYAIREGYSDVFEHKDDHAGEMETSLILYARPDLVHLDRADAGATRPIRFDAVRRGWVEITRPWHLLTTNSGSGNPHAATADKGRRWLDIIVHRLADFLVELAGAPIDENFPFEPRA